ncbi:MAG: hypothetical protein ACK4GC_07710, partial [Paracoccaceae bacterium]
MKPYHIADMAQPGADGFWERVRLTADVPCLIGGVFCGDRKVLQNVCISGRPDSNPGAAEELIRCLLARMSAFTTIRSRQSLEMAEADGDLVTGRFPIWLRLNNARVGVGRPLASLYPVVAYERQQNAPCASTDELLGLGL